MRGCEFVLAGRIVERPYDLSIYFVYQDMLPGPVARAFESPGAQAFYLGPGFQVIRVAAHDEPNVVMYRIMYSVSDYFHLRTRRAEVGTDFNLIGLVYSPWRHRTQPEEMRVIHTPEFTRLHGRKELQQ